VNITSEEILNRKATLEKELDETLSKANAISGAIQDCDYWLAMLSEEKEVKEIQEVKE
jgi:hypothetical protein